MRNFNLILDIGSHSLKLYASGETIEKIGVKTWEALKTSPEDTDVDSALGEIVPAHLRHFSVKAIGTEAIRRNPRLETSVKIACKRLGFSYRTLTQREEADLILTAFENDMNAQSLDLINVGGGSIQIIATKERTPFLLPCGISDLNRAFSLNHDDIDLRKISKAIAWISTQLPHDLKIFSYTGGEKTFLSKLEVPLSSQGFCERTDFERMAYRLAHESTAAMQALSPFDRAWMNGAIASNCVVIAAMNTAKVSRFHASDFNIAHGLIREIV